MSSARRRTSHSLGSGIKSYCVPVASLWIWSISSAPAYWQISGPGIQDGIRSIWPLLFLYAGYYAAAEHNEPLDRNAQVDYELLAYLTWADLVVSNDEGFFRRAFETMWKPRGKRLESAESFADLARRIL